MRYIVNNKEVSRDTFYFCKRAKEENKTFVVLANNIDVDGYINEHPDYDYYIRDDLATYYTKGEATVKEWFDKDHSWSTCTTEDMKKRYQKSKIKDTMTFQSWYIKNGWKFNSETKYIKESHDMPKASENSGVDVQTKLFSVTVTNANTLKAINEIREKYGEYCIEYVLRDFSYTEIIYKDAYTEI